MAVIIKHNPEVTAEYERNKQFRADVDAWLANDKNILSWDKVNLEWFMTKSFNTLHKTAVDNGKPNIIGLCGNMGCGKDTAIGLFGRYMHHPYTVRIAFADPIREIGQSFGFSMEQMTRRDLKELVDGFWGISPRQFMQMVGTEMFRDVWRKDVWIKVAEKKIKDITEHNKEVDPNNDYTHTIFITDVRFPNEAEMIKAAGGTIVRIKRPGFDKTGADLHESERLIDQIPADLTIVNDAANAGSWACKFTKELCLAIKKETYFGG